MINELVCWADGREMGRLYRREGRLTFIYAETWRGAPGVYPLSLSMPLASAEHRHGAVEPFLWGLLPDNPQVVNRWAASFQVSPRNVFGLIARVGEDCAGAIQFLSPERVAALAKETGPSVNWMTDADIAERLRILRLDASAGRAPSDLGLFSLAGAQPKTALHFDAQRWGVPAGRTPTTHILKPTTAAFDGHAENEHLCLRLARALGLPAVQSDVRRFEDVSAIVVTRYDRVGARQLANAAEQRAAAEIDARVMTSVSITTPVYRVHQEDFCQALSIHPIRKYQNEGGPTPRQIVDLLAAHSRGARSGAGQEDIQTFLDTLAFNWLIGGTDAHGKNYSILISGNGLVRLAPLCDVASIFSYPHIDPLRAKLAMRIADEYRLRDIGWPHWRKMAKEVGTSAEDYIERIRTMASRLPDALSDELAAARARGLNHPVLDRLAAELPARAKQLLMS